MSRPLRIAVAQYAPRLGDGYHNLELAVTSAQAAAAAGAELVVLPELAASGYAFADEAAAAAAAEELENSEFVKALTAVAAAGSCHIVVGVNEAASECRHNSAVLIGGQGVVATYRKLHLFNDEKSWFSPGAGLVVVDLPWGRLGIMICFDLWFPEVARAMALAEVEVIAIPTNWVGNFKATVFDSSGFCQGNYVAMVTAAQNGVVLACADRVGEERGTQFLGSSLIVGADGWPIAGPASAVDDALLIADVDLDSVAAARRRTPRNHLLKDRRPEAYNVAVVAAPERHPASPQ